MHDCPRTFVRSSRRRSASTQQSLVQSEVIVDHSLGVEKISRQMISAARVRAAQIRLIAQAADHGRKAAGVVGAEVES